MNVRVNRMKDRLASWAKIALTVAVVLIPMGHCTTTAVSCWNRGGSVVKNFFGWPTCLNAK